MKFTVQIKSRDSHLVHEVSGNRCKIGSAASADVVLPSWKVQKEHAELFISNEQLFVRDLGSMFGTMVDGRKVSTFGPLGADQVVAIGGFELKAIWDRHSESDHSNSSKMLNGDAHAVDVGVVSDADPHSSAALVAWPAAADVSAGSSAVASPTRHHPQRQPHVGAFTSPVSERTRPTPSQTAPVARTNSAQPVSAVPAASLIQAQTVHIDEDRLALRRSLQDKLIASFDLRRIDIHKMSDKQLREQAESALREILRNESLPRGTDLEALVNEVRDEAIGLGLLEPLLADPSVTEIMVNRSDEIFVERSGRLTRLPMAFSSEKSVMGIIERIVAPVGRRIDESSPLVDARLKDGSRFNAIIPPLALKGPSMTIRKFATKKLTGDDLISYGSASVNMVKFMQIAVQHKKNVIVSGGTGSGKTTLLNILSNFIPSGERIVTIEDAAELRLHHEHLVSLEARPSNAEGRGAVTIRDLVRNSLRMRPDRIVVGECRGGEALDMLQAMNTGHDGSLTTAHANSPRDMLARIEVMVLMSGMDLPVTAIREQVASAVDIVVQQTRYVCGSRKISKICEVTGVESGKIQLQDLFEFVETGYGEDGKVRGYFTGCGAVPEFYEKMQAAGMKLDISLFHKENG